MDSPCSSESSICMRDIVTNATETLAYLDQSTLKIKNDAQSLVLLFNNTKRPCSSSQNLQFTISVIEFTCGGTIGRPQLSSNFVKPSYLEKIPNECLFAFEWNTRIACKNSTRQFAKVELANGIIVDSAHTNLRVDMSDVFLNDKGFRDDFDMRKDTRDFNSYFVQFEPRNRPKCGDVESSVICQKNLNTSVTRDLGSVVEGYLFDVYSQILEV